MPILLQQEKSPPEVPSPKVVLYARVSTDNKGQTTSNQTLDLAAKGYVFDEIIEENISGSIAAKDREGFSTLFKTLRRGDTIVFATVSRLGRKTSDILSVIEEFGKMGVKVEIPEFPGVDFTSSWGNAILTMGALFSQMFLDSLKSATKAGLNRTEAEGTTLGPPLKIPPTVLSEMCNMRKDDISVARIYKQFKSKYSINAINTNIKKWADNLKGYEVEFTAREEQYKRNKHKIAARHSLKK